MILSKTVFQHYPKGHSLFGALLPLTFCTEGPSPFFTEHQGKSLTIVASSHTFLLKGCIGIIQNDNLPLVIIQVCPKFG